MAEVKTGRRLKGHLPPDKFPAFAKLKTLAGLAADPENPREILPENLAGLKVSIAEFGDLSGIVFNLRSGQLVCGHQRVTSLREQYGDLKIEHDANAAWIPLPTGETFDVRLVDWDLDRQRAANLAANNPHLQGNFTRSLLGPQLESLRAKQETLFQHLRLHLLTNASKRAGSTEPDAPVEPPAQPRSKLGDLYQLGEHRLLCGDSTSAADVARLLGKRKARLMNTDPPYGIAYDDETRVAAESAHGRKNRKVKWEGGIENDDLQDGHQLQAFLEQAIRTAVPHLVPNAAFYLWHPMLTQGTFFAAAAADILIHRQVIWVKPSLLFGFGDYHWRHELAFYGWIRGNRPDFYGDRNQTTIWELKHETSNAGRVHPTQKPVRLFEIPLENHTREGDVVYEPFSGSGSQIIAAERLRRVCCAMELDPRFVDATIARWEAYTGQIAKLVE